MSIFDKEEVVAPTAAAAVASVVSPAAAPVPAVTVVAATPDTNNTKDYWANAWANRGV